MPVRTRLLAATAALALGLGGALVVAAPASAAPADSFEVLNSSGDATVPDSLPWAVAQAEADPNHTDIVIGSAAGPVVTLDANLAVTTDVSITGPGASAFTVVGSSAAPADPVIDITGAGPVVVSGMSLSPSTAGNAHGIRSIASTLVLRGLTLDLPGRKADYLHAVADAALAGVLDGPTLRALPESDALEQIQSVLGLGPFAAELVLIRGANAPDVFPRTEGRLSAEIAEQYGAERAPREVADAWRPFRSWAAVHLRAVRELRTHEIARGAAFPR